MACNCGIDIHAHVVPAEFPSYLGGAEPAGWPAMAPGLDCAHRQVMIDGKNYRTVSDKCWTPSRRLADFETMALAVQVISPMPELLSYWMPVAAGAQLVRYLNEQIASMVAESEGKILGFGAVPLQDLDLAIRELHHLKHVLGLQGVEIGSNINGIVIGDARWQPFFEACVALDMPVFVHALRPAGMDRLVGPAPLQQVLAYPTDVGLAAASVLTGHLLTRVPGLRLAFSHGGGTLAMLLPRLQQALGVFPALRDTMPVPLVEQVRQLYFDTLVFDAPTLRHLAQTFGASQLMLGTDYPFNFHEPRPVDRLHEAGFDAQTCEQLLHSNARRFLGLGPSKQGP
jgi:aminocarboxymuconate-semialdehyde decarboxylase